MGIFLVVWCLVVGYVQVVQGASLPISQRKPIHILPQKKFEKINSTPVVQSDKNLLFRGATDTLVNKCALTFRNMKENIGHFTKSFSGWRRTKMSQKAIKNKHISARYSLAVDSRIQQELRNFMADPVENVKISVGNNIRQWIITLVGAEGTIYQGERFRLKFSFPTSYPYSPPSVHFLHPIPKHEHVYTNGDICLNLLGPGWMPTMTAQGIALSVLSMLSSAKEKKLPPDNAAHSDSAPGQQQNDWMYHDDKC